MFRSPRGALHLEEWTRAWMLLPAIPILPTLDPEPIAWPLWMIQGRSPWSRHACAEAFSE